MAERLRELVAVNRAIVSTLDYDEVLHLVVEKTAAFTHADACALLLLDDQNVLRVAASQGIDPEVAGELAAPLSERINVAVREMLGYREEDTFLGTPVIHRGSIAGLLVVCRRGHGDPSAEEEYLIGALADQAAIALEHARRYGEVAETQAQQSRLLESIQSNTTTYLVYLDRRLRFAEANAAYCGASGRSREALIGRSFSEVHAGAELEAALQKVLVRGEPAELHELPEVDGSGATVWWDWSVRPICDPDDGVEGLVLSAVDVTEEVRTRAALESASRQKDEFLAMLAHELRNPLSAIASAMELVGADSTGTTMRTRAREIASRQIDQMTRLLDDLLDVSRITSGRIRLERRRLDLRAVVEQAVEATMPLIGARRHALAVHLPDTPAMIDGDRHRLVQVVSNLLTNAAKYTPPEGHIEVEVRRADSTFELHVSDDGAGIAPEFLPHVFDLFSQGSRTLDRTEGGLGIGLTVVSRLVKMHGGEVEAHSEGLGRGSEVVARFPALVARAAADSATESGGARQAPPKRILLVEDNADAADMLATLLELEGHEVTIAGDGPRGIEAAERDKPEIVVLDIGLPGIDGFEVARRLRERDLQPPPRIVGLSGYGGEHDRERAQQVGMDGYLVKPVDHAKLRHLLGEAPSSSVPPPA